MRLSTSSPDGNPDADKKSPSAYRIHLSLSNAVINPDNCMLEMERVIAEARRNNQPAYVMPRTPGAYRTVLVPRGSSKPEWLPIK
jgi:hypothetical protein